MITLDEADEMRASHTVRSPSRAAGIVLMNTDVLPVAICIGPLWLSHTAVSASARAASWPLMMTLAEPLTMSPDAAP